MGHLWLTGLGIYDLIGGHLSLNGQGIYDLMGVAFTGGAIMASCCFVWKYSKTSEQRTLWGRAICPL